MHTPPSHALNFIPRRGQLFPPNCPSSRPPLSTKQPTHTLQRSHPPCDGVAPMRLRQCIGETSQGAEVRRRVAPEENTSSVFDHMALLVRAAVTFPIAVSRQCTIPSKVRRSGQSIPCHDERATPQTPISHHAKHTTHTNSQSVGNMDKRGRRGGALLCTPAAERNSSGTSLGVWASCHARYMNGGVVVSWL